MAFKKTDLLMGEVYRFNVLRMLGKTGILLGMLLFITVALTQAQDSAIVYIEHLKQGDPGISNMGGASDPVVSPDGRHVYVAAYSSSAINIFSRDAASGELTPAGAAVHNMGGVQHMQSAFSVDISPDGKHVYVGSPSSHAVVVLARDENTGQLSFVESNVTANEAFTVGGFIMVSVSPDGKSVYGVGGAGIHGLVVFDRNPETGRLTYVEEHIDGQNGNKLGQGFSPTGSPINNIDYSAAGDYLYITSTANAVSVYARNTDTGSLTLEQVAENGINGVQGIQAASSLVVSPDENFVYVSGQGQNAVSVFSRDKDTGHITYVEHYTNGAGGISTMAQARSLAMSPDGRYLYVSAIESNAITVFERNIHTGSLSVAASRVNGQDGVLGIATVSGMVTDPLNQNLYSAGQGENAIAVFSLPIPGIVLTSVTATADEGGPAVTLDDQLLIYDSDDTHLQSGSVRIASGFKSGDQLHVTTLAGVTVNFDAATGILTLSGSATLEQYRDILRSVTFQAGSDPDIGVGETSIKEIEFRVNDGTNESAAAVVTVTVHGISEVVEIGGNYFPTLADAADAINNGEYTGEIVMNIQENHELTEEVSFNTSGTGNASYDRFLLLVEAGITLTVGSEGSLKIPQNGVLYIENDAEIINNGIIEIASGAFFNNQGSSTPELTLYRGLEGFDENNPAEGEGWRYISSPVEVNLSDFLAPIWTQGLSGNPSSGNTEFGEPNVYLWDTTTEGNEHGDWLAITDLNRTLLSGQGVLVHVYADDNYDGQPNVFPKSLSVTGQESVPTLSVPTNTTNEGWTLLGNPYATAIDFTELLNQLGTTGLTNAVYVWTANDSGSLGDDVTNSGSWVTYTPQNGGSGDLTAGLIAPFQAFFVQNNEETSAVEFTNAIKSNDMTNTSFLFKEARHSLVRLELAGQGMANSAWLSLSKGGSLSERTIGDVWQLTPMSADYALLATEKPDAGLMDIGHYPLEGDLEIPLHTEATLAGAYTLTVTNLETDGTQLYLNDLETGNSLPLENGVYYEFTLSKAAKIPANPFALLAKDPRKLPGNNVRFTITTSLLEGADRETPNRVALNQNYPNPFNPTTQITFELPEASMVQLEVFDMAGRRVATLVDGQISTGSHSVGFDASRLSSGVYMYRLSTSEHRLMRKMTLIK